MKNLRRKKMSNPEELPEWKKQEQELTDRGIRNLLSYNRKRINELDLKVPETITKDDLKLPSEEKKNV